MLGGRSWRGASLADDRGFGLGLCFATINNGPVKQRGVRHPQPNRVPGSRGPVPL